MIWDIDQDWDLLSLHQELQANLRSNMREVFILFELPRGSSRINKICIIRPHKLKQQVMTLRMVPKGSDSASKRQESRRLRSSRDS